jgi:DNA-binding MarR family transcriptional regulator
MVALSTSCLVPLPDMSSGADERLDAWVAMARTYLTVTDRLERRMEQQAGIQLGWHEVLARLAGAPDQRLRMQDLAETVLLSKSGVTRLVDRMEEAGLVERDSCATDRRVVYAALTDRGREALARATPVFLGGLEELFAGHLTHQDAVRLRSILRAVLQGNGWWQEETCSAPVPASAAAAAAGASS